MNPIALSLVFVSAIVCVNAGADFGAEFLKDISGIKCRPGFVKLPTAVMSGLAQCTLESINIASQECFKTCVFNFMKIPDVAANGTTEIDFGSIDVAIMDAFDMAVKEGRTSYYDISQNSRQCAHKFLSVAGNKFATAYTEAKDCEKGDEFFKCCTSILKCPDDEKKAA